MPPTRQYRRSKGASMTPKAYEHLLEVNRGYDQGSPQPEGAREVSGSEARGDPPLLAARIRELRCDEHASSGCSLRG